MTLTGPSSGSYLPGCTLTLTATASATTGSISHVDFYQGSTLLATGTPMNGVYTYVWSNVPVGNYTLTAKAYDSHAAWTVSNAANITVTAVPCATPAFTPAAGTYPHSIRHRHHHRPNGATIRYTTDGTTPSETAGTVYSSPVSITASGTLQAIAYATGMSDSQIRSGSYTNPQRSHRWPRTMPIRSMRTRPSRAAPPACWRMTATWTAMR